jgi:hypothetical protein
MAISEYAQKYFGVEVLMHLTCSGQSREQIRQTLSQAKEVGIHNILALRGDPPKGALTWTPYSNGFERAVDLVRFIRQEFGDYFGIAVAGFPEGYPQATIGMAEQIGFLKEKIDAGADFVLTQFFYDPEVFMTYVNRCREAGITCPIIPGDILLSVLCLVHCIVIVARMDGVVFLIVVLCSVSVGWSIDYLRHDAHPELLVLPAHDNLLSHLSAAIHLRSYLAYC